MTATLLSIGSIAEVTNWHKHPRIKLIITRSEHPNPDAKSGSHSARRTAVLVFLNGTDRIMMRSDPSTLIGVKESQTLYVTHNCQTTSKEEDDNVVKLAAV